MSIAIIIPSGSTWESAFGRCLANLIGQLGYHQIPHTTLNIESSILPQARQMLLEFACGHQYALCLDSDITFPMDIVPMLMKREKPIIAANYTTQKPCYPVCHNMKGKRMSSRNKTGIEQATRIALGCALIDMNYVRNLPKPWFNFLYNPVTGTFGGEDYWFSDLLRKHNIDMWVDHDLSKSVGHIKKTESLPKHTRRKYKKRKNDDEEGKGTET